VSAPRPSLPVSGIRVQVRESTGEDELIALEPGPDPTMAMLALAQRLVVDGAGAELSWPRLPAVDLAAAALRIREAWLGGRINAETICPVEDCGEPIDVSFTIGDYLEHHGPRRPRGVEPAGDGWWTIQANSCTFRIPTIDDMVTASREARGAAWLADRCIRPGDEGITPSARRRVEQALAAMAPRLDDQIGGTCPVCGQPVDLFFEPIGYVLADLRAASSGLYADVHELAYMYHWSEASILSLDRRRRHGYVSMIRGELARA
jgi:hypothetical protein